MRLPKDFLALADEARQKSAFIAGYITAIHDIDRTGLHPLTDRTIRESAKRAWRNHSPKTETTRSTDA